MRAKKAEVKFKEPYNLCGKHIMIHYSIKCS